MANPLAIGPAFDTRAGELSDIFGFAASPGPRQFPGGNLTPEQIQQIQQQGGMFGGGGGGVPMPTIFVGGGGGGFGGGGGKNILEDPAYWKHREDLLGEELGLIGSLEQLARQGKGLTEEEAQLRRANIQKLLDTFKRQQDEQLQQRLQAAEEGYRGSFLSKGHQMSLQAPRRAHQLALQEAQQRAAGQVNMLNVGLEEAALSLQESLARLQAQRRQAEIEHQIELLRRP